MKKRYLRLFIILTMCVTAFSMAPLTASAASQSGTVQGVKYGVSCNPSTFAYKGKYTYVTSTASFSRTSTECIPVAFALMSKDVIVTANSTGFMEAATGNYCCSTGKIVYREVKTFWGGSAGEYISGFKKNGRTITKKYSLSSYKNGNGMSQNRVSDVYMKFPKCIEKNKVFYVAQTGSMTIQWKKYSNTKKKHKNNCNITLSAKYGVGGLKLNPKVSTSGCNISIEKTTRTGGLIKTHAYK